MPPAQKRRGLLQNPQVLIAIIAALSGVFAAIVGKVPEGCGIISGIGPKPTPRPVYVVILRGVRITPKNTNGVAWDKDASPPDPVVVICDDESDDCTTSGPFNNKFEARTRDPGVLVHDGDILDLKVYDKDKDGHDQAGHFKAEVSAAQLAAGEANWSFDRVRNLSVDFETPYHGAVNAGTSEPEPERPAPP